jgi:hypothetical protein
MASYLPRKSTKVIDPAETDFDDFGSDYLGEFEAICGAVRVD